MRRYSQNPVVKPNEVRPSSPELKVVCAFNTAVIEFRGQVLLLLRVAETSADQDNRYCLGAVLLDAEDPDRVLARSTEPLLQSEAPYEITGLVGNVVFTCGAITSDPDEILLYYGAADSVTALAVGSVNEIIDSLEEL